MAEGVVPRYEDEVGEDGGADGERWGGRFVSLSRFPVLLST